MNNNQSRSKWKKKSFHHGKSTNNKFSTRGKSNRNKKEKALDPNLFIKKAVPLEEKKYLPARSIQELPVAPQIIANLLKKGYEYPTEIQDKAIDSILEGRDVLGLAQTGTGKTGAFLIPIIHELLHNPPEFQVLIVSPTRELATQIEKEFKSMTRGLRLFSTCVIGGTSVRKDIFNLRRPSHFIIGTPGRILDLMQQKALNMKHFKTFVLDEFDRLLDMGFSPDIKKMSKEMINREQTILFSATEKKGQKVLLNQLLDNPVEVRVSSGNISGDHIDQNIVRVQEGERKMDVLLNMIRDDEFEKVIVFAETKRVVRQVCKDLRMAGIKADEIHGNKSQNYRAKALEMFRRQRIQVLVATDVAARGLDISDVTHVINYQLPTDFENYIHRIGRTGRAGKSGKAYTFVN